MRFVDARPFRRSGVSAASGLLFVLALLVAGCGEERVPARAVPPKPPVTPFPRVLVSVEEDPEGFHIRQVWMRSGKRDERPGHVLGPALPPPGDPRGSDGIAAVLYDREGAALLSRARSKRMTVFFDNVGTGLHGSTRIPEIKRFVFDLPVLREAAFLAFFHVRVPDADSGPFDPERPTGPFQGFHAIRGPISPPAGPPETPSKRWLGVRYTGGIAFMPTPGPEPGPSPLPDGFPDHLDLGPPFGIEDPLDLLEKVRLHPLLEFRLRELFDRPVGIVTVDEPHSSPAGSPLTIVIHGDGFDASAADSATFFHYSQALVDTLLNVEPFATLADSIRILRVRAVSQTSGITYCEDDSTQVPTHYRVRKCYQPDTPMTCDAAAAQAAEARAEGQPVAWPSFLGMEDGDIWRVHEAAAESLGPEGAHAHVMIANCVHQAARTDSDESRRICYVGIPPDVYYPTCGLGLGTTLSPVMKDSVFAHIAVHELGHALARLMDEYIGWGEWDGESTYPNMATLAQVDAGDVWWQTIVADSGFPVHRRLDTSCNDDHNSWDDDVNGNWIMLGAYWGCGFVESVELAGCDPLNDPQGAPFFRASSRCKMRGIKYPFCEVCQDTLAKTIRNPPIFSN
jgi:hypothetical protein